MQDGWQPGSILRACKCHLIQSSQQAHKIGPIFVCIVKKMREEGILVQIVVEAEFELQQFKSKDHEHSHLQLCIKN